MKICHLSKQFYYDYPSDQFPEMLLKEYRPYIQVLTTVNGLTFAVPLRSNISHDKDVLWTDKAAKCGLDFTKAIPILKSDYVDNKRIVIRPKEFQKLVGKDRIIQQKMEKCIKNYKKAKSQSDILHNAKYCDFSTLKYFESEIYTTEELAVMYAASTNE